MAKNQGTLKVKQEIDKGDKCVQLNYDFKDFPLPLIVNALFNSGGGGGKGDLPTQISGTSRSTFPVITSVKQLSPDVIEVRRAVMYHNFYNGEPYPEEVIRIDRSLVGGNEGYVYE